MNTQNSKPAAGPKLRNWRTRKGLTLEQVGDLLGVSHAHVSNLERGTDGPSLQLAEAIRKLTGGKVPLSAWVREAESAPGGGKAA